MIVFPQTKSDWCDSDLVACRSGSNCSRVRNLTLKGSRVKQQGDFHGSRRYLGGLTAAAGGCLSSPFPRCLELQGPGAIYGHLTLRDAF